MTLDDLITKLEQARRDLGRGDVVVTLTQQQRWPLEHHVGGVALHRDFDEDAKGQITIVEGTYIGYGSRHAWEHAE